MVFEKTFIDMLNSIKGSNIFLPVLLEQIIGQIESGTIELSPHPKSVRLSYYDTRTNKFYIDPRMLLSTAITGKLKYWIALAIDGEEDALKEICKILAPMMAPIMYYAIHIYNKQNRGILVKHEDTKKWYHEYFYRSMYKVTNGLTTISEQAAYSWTRQYLPYLVEVFEIPTYYNAVFVKKDLKKIGFQFNQFYNNVLSDIDRKSFDQISIDALRLWFETFSKEFALFFLNQKKRIVLTIPGKSDLGYMERHDLKATDLTTLDLAYKTITISDCIKYRFPVPIMRELFITSEPLAQAVYAATIEDLKIKRYPEWQKLASRGLSFLG